MHKSSLIQRIYYGVDHLNFYFRFDFQAGQKPGIDTPNELHLYWYYADQTLYNSPMALEQLKETAPFNFQFRHHLKLQLPTLETQFEEAIDYGNWETRDHQVKAAVDQSLELSIPWANLAVQPDWGLNILVVLAQDGTFVEHLPEDALISFNVP